MAVVMTIANFVKSEYIESCTQNKTIALTVSFSFLYY